MRNQPMGGMPMPMMFLQSMPQDLPSRQMIESVPPRVGIALDFLQMMQVKTLDRAAVSDSMIQVLEAKPLEREERIAMSSACHLLSAYFSGTLEPDLWDAQHYRGVEIQHKMAGVRGRYMYCPNCGDHPRRSCELCAGSGAIIVTPAAKGPPVNEPPRPGKQDEDEDEDEGPLPAPEGPSDNGSE